MRFGIFISDLTGPLVTLDDVVASAQAAEAAGFTSGWVPHIPWSHDALTALESIDCALAARCMRNMISMKGRFVHRLDGNTSRQNYDSTGQVPYSGVCYQHVSPHYPVWPSGVG